jgi:hypothetical protein
MHQITIIQFIRNVHLADFKSKRVKIHIKYACVFFQEIADKLNKNFECLEEVRHQVVDQELIEWKRQQQLAGNGAPFDPNLLENLQKW